MLERLFLQKKSKKQYVERVKIGVITGVHVQCLVSKLFEIIVFTKLERKTVRHMMLSVALIALGYIVAVVGADSNSVIVAGLLIMLVGWFFLLRSGHGTLHPKSASVAKLNRLKESVE